jgi:prepilin-type N-terminal cleavage/methylation domain-containing protein
MIIRHSRNFRCGFSLVEVAIVLTVIGIILAAIWSAATTAFENSRRAQTSGQLSTIVANIRATYAGQANIGGAVATLTPSLVSQSAIPGDMVRNHNLAAGIVDDPWGSNNPGGTAIAAGSLGVCAWTIPLPVLPSYSCSTNSAASSQYFAVEFQGLKTDSCIAIVTANSSSNGPTGLADVIVNGTSIVSGTTTTHALPVLQKDAASLCPPTVANNGATVDFIYLLRAPAS